MHSWIMLEFTIRDPGGCGYYTGDCHFGQVWSNAVNSTISLPCPFCQVWWFRNKPECELQLTVKKIHLLWPFIFKEV